MPKSSISILNRAWLGVKAYAIKFGVVGAIGVFIDWGISNYLWYTYPDQWIGSVFGGKFISTSVAILFNWVGNRYWTFREHRRKNFVREFVEYLIVSLGGMAIALGCLWISHRVLGLNNVVANNISGNVIGLGLGTLFRFLLYRYWVWGHHRTDGLSNLTRVEEAQSSLFAEPTPSGSIPALPPKSTPGQN